MAIQLTETQRIYQKAYGLWFGAVFAAVIGLMWTGIFSSFIGGTARVILLIVFLASGLFALARAVRLRRTRPLKKTETLPYLHAWSFWFKFYGVIAAEFIIIFLIIHILKAHHVANIVFPAIVFVVGAHFYPLAKWNGAKVWYVTATVLCGMVALLFIFVPDTQTTNALGANASSTWSLVSSGTMALTMLLTSLVSSMRYRHLVPRAKD